jgi:soluble lytic murein transglycosylase-like protein
MKIRILVTTAALAAGAVLLNVASKPSTYCRYQATFSASGSLRQPLEMQVADMLAKALAQSGQRWSESSFDGTVQGVCAAVRETGLRPSLVLSLVQAESAFHPEAVSSCGAVGLTQLLPATARSVAREKGLPVPSWEPATWPSSRSSTGPWTRRWPRTMVARPSSPGPRARSCRSAATAGRSRKAPARWPGG